MTGDKKGNYQLKEAHFLPLVYIFLVAINIIQFIMQLDSIWSYIRTPIHNLTYPSDFYKGKTDGTTLTTHILLHFFQHGISNWFWILNESR